jgi:hypothetical protein
MRPQKQSIPLPLNLIAVTLQLLPFATRDLRSAVSSLHNAHGSDNLPHILIALPRTFTWNSNATILLETILRQLYIKEYCCILRYIFYNAASQLFETILQWE